MVIHVDSSYLIDLLREQKRGQTGRATAFLEEHASDDIVVPLFVVCELEAGAANAPAADRERARLQALLQVVTVAYPDERFPPVYGEILVTLKGRGRTVDTMDLLIAAGAVVEQATLVTANRRHFAGIPGLTVIDY